MPPGEDYQDFPHENAGQITKIISVLIVTATDVESDKIRERLKPLPSHGHVLRIFKSNATYYVGLLGRYVVVQVQSNMGAVGEGASLITISQSIDLWHPKAVIMIGIAFGIYPEEQQIGDVLISKSIIPYDIKRVGEDQTIYRGEISPASRFLRRRVKDLYDDWSHLLPSGKPAKVQVGPLLSGESLIDNEELKKQLVKIFEEAIGGEMEGVGLQTSCDAKRIDWLIMKGVCDYADGNKKEDKEIRQKIAAEAASSLCEHLLTKQYAFDEIGFIYIDDGLQEIPQKILDPSLVNKILFDVYREENEPFYLARNEDNLFNDTIRYNSVWISGECGCGKTNLILRNLIANDKKYIFIDLSRCVGESNVSLLYNVYLEIIDVFRIDNGRNPDTNNASSIIKEIVRAISSIVISTELIINIDEIPISNIDIFNDFFTKLVALQIAISNTIGNEKVKFIASTICTPPQNFKDFHKKVHEKIKFINISYWNNTDINKLISIITAGVNIDFSPEQIEIIIEKASGSPRFIKKFTRNFITNTSGTKTFTEIVSDTQNELR